MGQVTLTKVGKLYDGGVTAVSAECDGHVLSREARQQVSRHE